MGMDIGLSDSLFGTFDQLISTKGSCTYGSTNASIWKNAEAAQA